MKKLGLLIIISWLFFLPVQAEDIIITADGLPVDLKGNLFARVVTNTGDVIIKLDYEKAPITVNNFIRLANRQFYDGQLFYRLDSQTGLILAGDPLNNGLGGPGYSIADEFDNRLANKKGFVGMDNDGTPGSAGSRFYFMLSDNEQRDGKYTVFGEVDGNKSILDIWRKTATDNWGRPVKPIIIKRVQIYTN